VKFRDGQPRHHLKVVLKADGREYIPKRSESGNFQFEEKMCVPSLLLVVFLTVSTSPWQSSTACATIRWKGWRILRVKATVEVSMMDHSDRDQFDVSGELHSEVTLYNH
jgi:hypothetical protein